MTPPTHNLIGSVGAVFSSLLFSLIGGAAYLFPVLLGLLGGRCFTQSDLSIRLRNAGASLAALLFLSGLLHLEVTAVPTVSSGMVFRGQAGGSSDNCWPRDCVPILRIPAPIFSSSPAFWWRCFSPRRCRWLNSPCKRHSGDETRLHD